MASSNKMLSIKFVNANKITKYILIGVKLKTRMKYIYFFDRFITVHYRMNPNLWYLYLLSSQLCIRK